MKRKEQNNLNLVITEKNDIQRMDISEMELLLDNELEQIKGGKALVEIKICKCDSGAGA